MLQLEDPRRAYRQLVDLPCELIVNGWDTPVGHSLIDASAFGAWVRSSFPGKVGDVVVCCLQPPGWEQRELMVFAKVQRVRRPSWSHRRHGMALEFLDITPHQQLALHLHLQRLPGASGSQVLLS